MTARDALAKSAERRYQRELLAAVLDSVSRQVAGGQRPDPSGFAMPFDEYTPPPVEQVTDPDPEPVAADETDTRQEARGNYGGQWAWGGYANGMIPAQALAGVGDGHRLEPGAARAWNRMVAAAAADGVTLKLSSSYRSFDAQVRVRKTKGDKVATATPGRSVHGWGRAVDVSGAKAQKWLRENGERFGWVWPGWARREGKSYEPWHFNYVGGGGG